MAGKLTIKARPVGVQIVGRKSLVKWLKSRPTTLTPEGVVETTSTPARRPPGSSRIDRWTEAAAPLPSLRRQARRSSSARTLRATQRLFSFAR